MHQRGSAGRVAFSDDRQSAGILGHIQGNMWFLGVFGDDLEGKLGRFRFLTMCPPELTRLRALVLPAPVPDRR